MTLQITRNILFFFIINYSFFANADDSEPITTHPWQEVVVSVHDLDISARFFIELADYEVIWRGAESKKFLLHLGLGENDSAHSMVLKSPGSDFGFIRLIQFINVERQIPTRIGARPWDTGCFTSIMVRAKGLEEIYNEAIKMGWWTETPITELEFGTSKLKIVIFKGPQGLQVQAYERLSPPLPLSFPDFDGLSVPFNIMQTVKSREVAKHFFVDQLGFDTLFYGPPVISQKETQIPLGIPLNQTTKSRYQAGILYPIASEVGRVELVEFLDLKGEDYRKQCEAPNFGILSIKFPINDVNESLDELEHRGISQEMKISNIDLAPYGNIDIFSIKSPDGANIEFYSMKK
jgi:hypothetical protein